MLRYSEASHVRRAVDERSFGVPQDDKVHTSPLSLLRVSASRRSFLFRHWRSVGLPVSLSPEVGGVYTDGPRLLLTSLGLRQRGSMDFMALLRFSVEHNASDIHVQAGLPPHVRMGGILKAINQ